MDSAGNLYITELENNVVRKVTPSGVISTIAGTGHRGFSGGGGPATAAQLSFPMAVAVDNAGNVSIADEDNGRVRKVTPDGTITTIVGSGVCADPTDGGAATATPLDYPEALAVASDGTLFISDSNGHALLRLGKDGAVHVVAGPSQYWKPRALAFDADGNLLVSIPPTRVFTS